ncbi:hypothetical protein E2C01_095088 [Portunus trituberculatus]|uniref:Uncharacterized protein n=1 Tax=Portunus trituberculatus TaxID=210409 RepID=A0A5B7JS85_PORTR|nr:hypothetical protein [Portunus trituberculatus]
MDVVFYSLHRYISHATFLCLQDSAGQRNTASRTDITQVTCGSPVCKGPRHHTLPGESDGSQTKITKATGSEKTWFSMILAASGIAFRGYT